MGWAGRLLTITAGNTVDLSSLAGATSAVDLTSYLKNTNSQSLGLSGSALTITGGNTINLAPINTDNQTVSLTGSNLTISGGNTVNLASINTDVLAGLSCSAGQLAQWNGSVWACASPAASSDAQTLSLAGDNLTILNGNSVSLAGYLDNTDSQSLSLAGNTLSLVNGGSVSLAAYLDNTDVLASLSCSAGQLPQWNGTAWACLTPSAGTDSQNFSHLGFFLGSTCQNDAAFRGLFTLHIFDDNTVTQGFNLHCFSSSRLLWVL